MCDDFDKSASSEARDLASASNADVKHMARWTLSRPDHDDVPGLARIFVIAGVSTDMVQQKLHEHRADRVPGW